MNADGQLNLTAGSTGLNVYAYCYNNPVRLVDHFGTSPDENPWVYKWFTSIEAAARDAAAYMNVKSITENVEYATIIYEDRTGNPFCYIYTYEKPEKGTKNYVDYPDPVKQYADSICAYVHTHGAYEEAHIETINKQQVMVVTGGFSLSDYQFIEGENAARTCAGAISNIPLYLGTPLGSFLVHYPYNKETTLIDYSLPYDPNYPWR